MSSPKAIFTFIILLFSSWCICCCPEESKHQEPESTCEAVMASLSELEDFEFRGAVSVYGPENLHDYLDGGAEFYLKSGFRRLATALVVSRESDLEITVEIFQIGNPSSARFIYETERGNQPDNLEVRDKGFISGSYVEFVKGKFVVKLMGFGAPKGETNEITALARFLATRIQS